MKIKSNKTLERISELKHIPLNYAKLTFIDLTESTINTTQMGVSEFHQTDAYYLIPNSKPISKIVDYTNE